MGSIGHDVLVVDDEGDLRRLAVRRLSRAGHEVREARDGEEAWGRILERVPDVAVLDVRMPGLDGLELTRRIREDARFASLPIVLLTASVAEDEEVAGQQAGADVYLRKPCSSDELLGALANAIARHERGSGDA